MGVRIDRWALVALLVAGCGGHDNGKSAFSDTGTTTATDAGGSLGIGTGGDASNTSGTTSGDNSGGTSTTTGSAGSSGGAGSPAGGNAGTGGSGGDAGGSGGSGAASAAGGSGGNGGAGATGGSGGTGVGGTGGSGGAGGNGGNGGSGGNDITLTDSCEQPTCGGDLEDTSWSYTGICIQRSDVLSPLAALCADVDVIDLSGSLEGSIDFLTDTFERDATLTLNAKVLVPGSCPTGNNCAIIQTLAATQNLTVECANDTDNPDDCVCQVPLGGMVSSSGNYSTNGSTLTLDAQESDYCAESGTLRYTGTVQGVPFVYEAATSQ